MYDCHRAFLDKLESTFRYYIADVDTWNPAFDVTPAALITGGIITEKGVVQAPIDTPENLALLQL